MNTSSNHEDLVSILNRPLPPEALKQHPTKKYLTTINAIYVIERFNEAFGLSGWRYEVENTSVVEGKGSRMVIASVRFKADGNTEKPIERFSFGGNDNPDLGDAYKGAVTDALTKIGSMLGIGVHVWKNQSPAQASAAKATKDQIGELSALDLEGMGERVQAALRGFKRATIQDFTEAEADKVIRKLRAERAKASQ